MLRWFGLFALGALLFWGGCTFALTLEVHLKEVVTVFGETLVLGDVAEISYPDPYWEDALRKLSLGVLPPPGNERTITPREIYTRIVERGVPGLDYIYFSGASAVRVRTEGVILPKEAIAEKIRAALQERFPQAERIEVTLLEEREVAFPSAAFAVILPATVKPWGTQRAVLVDVTETYKREVRFMPSVYRSVVRAARNLAPGETLREGDVTIRLEPLSPENEKALGNLDAVLGRSLRRVVRAGDVVVSSSLARDVLVKRGDLVTLVAQYKGIVVTTAGKARGEGGLGDRIVVENLSSRKRMEGIIVDERTVQVIVQ
ncbi:MAG: flagellar basal body P-ring formation chaperone FlgA [Atribacterota bacterium]